ncbi:MAG TPA: tetratricopeptide repeat protein [Candidatus Ozemobacteraceae bacterium]|nr:tetratricopeptide repeat protein [Candidatus Ozemobacteraceae bacterium]
MRNPFRTALCRLLLVLALSLAGLPSGAAPGDAPETVQQYKYALGLIQRKLYEEADHILSRINSDPTPFSNRDASIFWQAECRYRSQNFRSAIALYSQLLADYPQSSFRNRAAYGLGWAHAKDNNPKSAIEAFGLVQPSDRQLWIDARLKSGFLMVKYGMGPEKIAQVYEQLLAEKDLKPAQRQEAHLQAGIVRFNQSLHEQAITHFQEALPLSAEDQKPGVAFYLAESFFRHKQYPEAITQYESIIASSPRKDLQDKAVYSLAWCHIKNGKPEMALPLFGRLADDPTATVRAEAIQNLIDLLMNLHRYQDAANRMKQASQILSGDKALEMEYMRGLALSRLGEYQQSLTAFQTFIKSHPKHVRSEDARYQSALVRISLGKYREALDDLSPLLRRETTPAVREKALYRTGECYFNLGNITSARETFERLIADYPQGTARMDALFQLGEIAYQSGRHADALEAFTTIGKGTTDLASQAVFRAGEVLMKAGRYPEAVKQFEEYLTRFPKGSLREDALFKTGLCQIELKDPAQALVAFSQLRDSTGYFRQEARFQIGEISRQLGNHPLAIQQYKAIIAEEPTNPIAPRARRAVGISLFLMKDYAGAVETFEGILKDYPATDVTIPETRLWLGRSLLALDRTDDGISELLKIPVMYPKSPLHADAYAEAARGYHKAGRRDKAKRMWAEVLRIQPSGPLADEAAAYKP